VAVLPEDAYHPLALVLRAGERLGASRVPAGVSAWDRMCREDWWMFSKILLPLDGSELSLKAADHAKALAEATKATVVLVQVIDSEAQLISQASGITIEPIAMGEVTVDAARSAVAAQRAAAQQNLDAVKATLEGAGLSVETVIREGQPGEEIVDAVQEHGCDVVVIATHGRTGFRRAILGSVADHVARHTPTASVLLIRPTSE